MNDEIIRLTFGQIGTINADKILYVITMFDEEKRRQLCAVVDEDAWEIMDSIINKSELGCYTLANNILEMLGEYTDFTEYFILICGLSEGEYRSCLTNTRTRQKLMFRLKDAIALSLLAKIPIYITKALMEDQSTPINERTAIAPDLPINILPTETIEAGLQQALEREDYETASTLSDELKRRKQESEE